ncbi:MAG: DUF2752 domain-containing protein [Clostridia bacterium]|nr:DUF2752 domain-containing protein [Clostridia bacterium]
MIKRRSAKIYLWIHAGVLLLLCLFPLYRAVSSHITQFVSGCLLHDHFFLYCPLCGGTRALEAMLHLDFFTAWQDNALVVVLAVFVIAADIVALVRLFRGHERLLPLPAWSWIVLVVLMVAYAVLRNYLMIAHGYDPVGDLGAFWSGIAS